MDLSIIIINWNSCSYVRECLKTIIAYPPAREFEVIVLDSGSLDGCGEMVEAEFPNARFIQRKENLGFARANNAAVESARGEYLLFLNPDTEVRSEALERLCEALDRMEDAGAVGARLLNSDGSLQTSCTQAFPTILNQALGSDVMLRIFSRTMLWGTAPLYYKGPGYPEVEAVSGAALLMRRKIFETLDGFNEGYFMYSEDIDLCFRARSAGWTNYLVPQAAIVHHGGGSSKQRPSRFASVMKVEAVWRYLCEHRGAVYAALYRCFMAVTAVGRLVLLIFPFLALKLAGKEDRVRVGLIRWSYILRWALGLESWSQSRPAPEETGSACERGVMPPGAVAKGSR